MSAKDIFGIVLIVVGAGVAPVGWRWLGSSWFWGGIVVLAAGLALVMNAARERSLREETRKGGGAGDYGNRDYLGGTSSASDHSGGDSGGDGE